MFWDVHPQMNFEFVLHELDLKSFNGSHSKEHHEKPCSLMKRHFPGSLDWPFSCSLSLKPSTFWVPALLSVKTGWGSLYCLCLRCVMSSKSKSNCLCEIKLIFYGKAKNIKHEKPYLSALWPPLSPPTVYCVSALCIGQTSLIGRDTCSTINNILLPSTRQLLKRSQILLILWSATKTHHFVPAYLDYINCQYII